MTEIKRNALLKELSRKLEDQVVPQSGGTLRTITDSTRVVRLESRQKHHILYEQARSLKEAFASIPKQ